MALFQDVSLQRKQMLILMLTAGGALLIACAAFIGYEWFTFLGGMRRNLSDLALRIAEQNTATVAFDTPDVARTNLANVLKNDPNIVRARLYGRNGLPLADYQRPGDAGEPPPATLGREEIRFKSRRVTLQRPFPGDVGIYLEADLQEMYARMIRYAGIVAAVLLASSLVALAISSRLQKVVSEPILELARMAQTVSEDKNYSVRARKKSTDEIGVLIDGFNGMLAQIQERDAALLKAQNDLERRVTERTGELQLEIAERTRAEMALHQQFSRISLLNQITHAVSERQDLASIAQVVLRQLEDHLPTDFGSLLLHDGKNDLLTVAASRWKARPLAPPPEFRERRRLPAAEAGLGECFKGKSIYLPETRGQPGQVCQALSRLGLASLAALPLVVEGRIFGILLCARDRSEAFSSGEREFLGALCEHVALAAHQAQLHDELQGAYDELRQTQQAVMQQERLRALGKMASGIAHDINNALSPIVVYSELLLRTEAHLTDTSKRYLDHIKTSGEDIAHIVSRMREFYRRREGTEPLFAVNLNDLAQQVIELTRPRWKDIPQERGLVVEMDIHLAPDLPPVLGNGSELREALTNLILNAVDAMPAGGKMRVATSVNSWNHTSDGAPVTSFITLEVRDSGIGMDEETRNRCLEPFFSTKGQRGTGLGLAMVYGVMERHEGKIEIESEPGKGTAIRLVFPVRDSAELSLAPAPGRPREIPALRILCIDDEPLLRELLKEILESDGHKVAVADGGQAGIEAFRSARDTEVPFHVVITDLGMPYVDGRQVATTLKREAPGTPVIMLTGWGTMMKADGDVPAQVDAVLSKPPRMNELRETLFRVTQSSPAVL